MRHITRIMMFVFLWGLSLDQEALLSQVPQTLSYQGVLTDTEGNAVPDGNYTLTFRLYRGATNSVLLWEEMHPEVPVQKGIFNVILGSREPLNLPFDQPYFLGISVGEDAELTPRIELTASAYSLHARSIADSSVSADKIRDGAITQSKLAPDVGLPPGGEAGGDLTGSFPNPTIAEGAVTRDKLANAAVSEAQLADSVVSTTKLQDDAVTQAKLAPEVSLPPGGEAGGDLTGTFPNPTIAEGAVSTNKLADDAVTSTKIDTEQVVKSLRVNNAVLQDDVTLEAGANVTLDRDGNQVAISAEAGGADADWTVSGDNMSAAVSGNVGIGRNNPQAKLHVDALGSTGGLVVTFDGRDSVHVGSIDGDGVFVKQAGSPDAMHVSDLENGFEIAGAEGYGMYVGRADVAGMHVSSVGGSGFSVSSAEDYGLSVISADLGGIRIREAGSPSDVILTGLKNGIEILGAEDHGLFVGRVDRDGIFINSAADNGVFVDNARQGIFVGSVETEGLEINSAGGDGVRVQSAGGFAGNFMGNVHVADNLGIGTTDANESLSFNNVTGTKINLFDDGAGIYGFGIAPAELQIGAYDGGKHISLGHYSGSSKTFVEWMRVDAGGNLGIGTKNPQHPLEFGNGAHVTAGGVWKNSSSRENKENITDLTQTEAINALEKLNPVKFNYRVEKREEYIGFIAEEVPELVANRDRKTLSTMDIVAVLTEVVQSQQETIFQLKKEIEQLKQEHK